jgi:hypothetical protein
MENIQSVLVLVLIVLLWFRAGISALAQWLANVNSGSEISWGTGS